MKRLPSIAAPVLACVLVGATVFAVTNDSGQKAVVAMRTTSYAQGVADGKAQAEQRLSTAKAPTEVQTMADGFCTGAMVLSWFDPNMGITQADIDAYAAEPHGCSGTRYLGSVDTERGTDYIFVVNQNDRPMWWVFTVVNGKITEIQ